MRTILVGIRQCLLLRRLHDHNNAHGGHICRLVQLRLP
jgi:hypothetical protein